MERRPCARRDARAQGIRCRGARAAAAVALATLTASAFAPGAAALQPTPPRLVEVSLAAAAPDVHGPEASPPRAGREKKPHEGRVGAAPGVPGQLGASITDWWTWELVNSVPPMEAGAGDSRPAFGKHIWESRASHWRRDHAHHTGIRHFFTSAQGGEWTVFAIMLISFIGLQLFLMDWPSTKRHHWSALIIWLSAGAIYNLVMWDRLGPEQGQMWMCGYWQELVFSMENVFIFHTIVEIFKTPRKMAQKALFVIVLCQVLFQMVFFMGLAHWLQSMKVLPYMLGVWLMYLGVTTLRGQVDHGKSDVDLQDLQMYRLFHVCLGDRLSTRYHESNIILRHAGQLKVSMLGPAIACLLLADFAMEIDVTLTKIESTDNHFVAFTSSVAAAFAMPELFFVAGDLFQRYALLHYGIAFVLIFFASQLMLHEVVHIPDMIGIAIILLVMMLCIAASRYLEASDPKRSGRGSSVEEGCESDSKDTRLQASIDGNAACTA